MRQALVIKADKEDGWVLGGARDWLRRWWPSEGDGNSIRDYKWENLRVKKLTSLSLSLGTLLWWWNVRLWNNNAQPCPACSLKDAGKNGSPLQCFSVCVACCRGCYAQSLYLCSAVWHVQAKCPHPSSPSLSGSKLHVSLVRSRCTNPSCAAIQSHLANHRPRMPGASPETNCPIGSNW